MNIQQSVLEGITVIAPTGRIDTTTSGPLEEAIRKTVDAGARDLVIDFATVDYISSAGLRVFLVLAKRMRDLKGRLMLCGMPEPVRAGLSSRRIPAALQRRAVQRHRARALCRAFVSTISLHIEPPTGAPSDRECGDRPITFGRGADADVVVTDGSMSRTHARIVADGDGWAIEDLGARNGTFVNGERVQDRRRIVPGDVIKMGGTVVRVTGPEGEPENALGGSDLASSIFRSVTDLTDGTIPGAAPARVAARLKALNDFHRSMAGSITLDELLERLLDRLFSALHPEEGVILLRQTDGTLATAASRRLPVRPGEHCSCPAGSINEVVDKGTAALVSDLSIDERFSSARQHDRLRHPKHPGRADQRRRRVRRHGGDLLARPRPTVWRRGPRAARVARVGRGAAHPQRRARRAGGRAPGPGSRARARARHPDGDAAAAHARIGSKSRWPRR